MSISNNEYFDFFKNLKYIPLWEESAFKEKNQIKIFKAIIKKTKKMGPSFSPSAGTGYGDIPKLMDILKENYKINNKLKRIEWDRDHSKKNKIYFKNLKEVSKQLKIDYINTAYKLTKEIPALKIHDAIYTSWDKIASLGEKLYNNKEHYLSDPDYTNLSKGISLGNTDTDTGIKYLNYIECKYPQKCAKYLKALKNDLKVVMKVYNKLFKSSSATKSKKACLPGTKLNPKTGMCNKTKSKKACLPGTRRNPKTGRCNKTKSKKPCLPGTRRNPKTGRCNKTKSNLN